jgi:hypothetical protein
MRLLPLLLLAVPCCCRGTAAAAVCSPGEPDDGWVFRAPAPGAKTFSCASSAGGTNDLGGAPTPCAGGDDPTSVRIAVQRGKAECLVASASQCKIPMRNFTALDYDLAVSRCNGVWAAPLWMTPDKWQWGPGSGEIDSTEFCARDAIHLNFAGGGHQIALRADNFDIDDARAHVTVRKDAAGIVTITACAPSAASPQCPTPVYQNCDECKTAGGYACWCNPPENIYGSGGCQNGGDCQWTLIADIWNGVSGDSGFAGCMTAVPGIGLAAGEPNLDSNCTLSVERVVVRGSGPGGKLIFGPGSPPDCAVLTV